MRCLCPPAQLDFLQQIHASEGVKLLSLELPDISGDMNEFSDPWEIKKKKNSNAVRYDNSVPPAMKFLHLKSMLKGNAKDLTSAVQLLAESYEEPISFPLRYSILWCDRPRGRPVKTRDLGGHRLV